jgi:hypothetical protein
MNCKKKQLLLLVLGLLLPIMVNAQNYTRDAGVRVGDHFSGTFRQFSEDDRATEGMLFIGRRGFTFTLLKEYFQPALGSISENLFFEYGFGAHAGFSYIDHYTVLNRTYLLDDYRFTPLFGLDGIIGLEYRFPEFPFLISLDIKPCFEYSLIQYFNINLNTVGISLKYRF